MGSARFKVTISFVETSLVFTSGLATAHSPFKGYRNPPPPHWTTTVAICMPETLVGSNGVVWLGSFARTHHDSSLELDHFFQTQRRKLVPQFASHKGANYTVQASFQCSKVQSLPLNWMFYQTNVSRLSQANHLH